MRNAVPKCLSTRKSAVKSTLNMFQIAVTNENVGAISWVAAVKPAARVNCQHATHSPPQEASRKAKVATRSATGQACHGCWYHGSEFNRAICCMTLGSKCRGAGKSG